MNNVETRSRAREVSSWMVLAALLVGGAGAVEAAGTATTYHIDPSHSAVEFTVPFMGITRVPGRFNQFYGTVVHDSGNLSAWSAEVVIRAASIDTRNDRRDRDLRSENYFDTERFPVMTFESRRVVERDGGPVLIGNLTIRDVTREVELPFTILGTFDGPDGHEMGAEATTSFDRREFGISKGQFSGDQVFIGNEVSVRLLMRLRQPSEAKRSLAAAHPAVAVAPDGFEGIVGRYSDAAAGFELAVHQLEDELVLERGGTLLRMLPIGESRFRLQDFAAIVRFERRAGGQALVLERPDREPQVYLRVTP